MFIACTTTLVLSDAFPLGLAVVVGGVVVFVVVVVVSGDRVAVLVLEVLIVFFVFLFFAVDVNHAAFHRFLLPTSCSIWWKVKFGSTSMNMLSCCPIWNYTLIVCFSSRWSGTRRM